MKFIQTILLLCFISFHSIGQKSFLIPSDTFNKKRFNVYVGTLSAITVLNYAGTYSLWYSNYPQSSFHFFNDIGEWNQLDKFGHMTATYYETKGAYYAQRWAGVSNKKAIWYAGLTGFGFHSIIEVFDGFSTKWGASVSDLGANAIGSALFVSQQLIWNEQRFKLKASFNTSHYDDKELQNRRENLFGRSALELAFKDYNGLNFWLSFCPSDFNPKLKHLKWLGLAVGYRTGGMFGGYENKWITVSSNNDTTFFDRSDVVRYRRFLIAIDYDLEKIKVKRPGWKLLLGALNYFKLPAPALEFNTKGEIIFHPIYTLGFEVPIYLKR